MPIQDIRWIRAYLLAILTVFLALQATVFIQPYLSTSPPFITFLAAIMVTAWYGGFRPALFATLLSVGLIDYYLIEPVQSFHLAPADFGSLVFFGVVATPMGYTIAHLQQARQVAVTAQKQLEHLHALSQQLLNDDTLERKLQRVLTAVLDLLGTHKGVIRLYDPATNTLTLTTQVGFNQEQHSPQFQHVSVDSSSCGTVIQRTERVRIDNIATDARCLHLAALPAMSDVVSAQSMPLFRADRSIFGVLTTYHTRRSIPSEADFRLVDVYARQAERVLEAKSLEDELRGVNTDLAATLEGLISELAGTEARERQHLASELHDALAQFLALSQLKLNLAQRFLSHSPGTSARYIQETAEAITHSLEYARTLIAELCPPEVYDAGLPASLQWLAAHMAKHGLAVELNIMPESWTLPKDRVVLLYKLIRELLMNVVKHAAVDQATVSIHVDSSQILVMSVQDGGRGFDTGLARGNDTSAHFGLRHVRERMTMMGGGYHLDSTIGRGTTITLSLPLGVPSRSEYVRTARAPQQDRVKAKPARLSTQERLPWDTC